MGSELIEKMYYQMIFIRGFEERVFDLFSQAELAGTTHACIGQEADAVAVIDHLAENDIVVSNHRCHGHYLARTGDAEGLFAELMGRSGGICGGRGGSQHLQKGNFYTNGIQGGMFPIAAGMALAEKKNGSGAITVIFVGDGTFGEGTVYESLNIASLWDIPLLVVVENNYYAQSTPQSHNLAGTFIGRGKGFSIDVTETDARNTIELHQVAGEVIANLRKSLRPHLLVINTYRFCPHSKGDDFRPVEEIDMWKATDPLCLLGAQLSNPTRKALDARAKETLKIAEVAARHQPLASL